MIPVTASDILKILEKFPEWAGLKRLSKRIDDLENQITEVTRRVAALEPAGRAPAKPSCPNCGGPMRTAKVQPAPGLSMLGIQLHTLRCEPCGHEEQRQIDPPRR